MPLRSKRSATVALQLVALLAGPGSAAARAAPLALPASVASAAPVPRQESSATATPAASASAPTAPAEGRPKPSRDQALAAIDAVRHDPDIAPTHVVGHWQWKHPDKPRPLEAHPTPDWLKALADWLANGGRFVVWAGGAVIVAFALVSGWRWMRWRADAAAPAATALPSHVRDLDIRPESLPDDIGAAARALWQAGESRAALSLLYRGALSRLVHGHALPIRSSSTEGDCMRLAARALAPERSAFFARLVAAWQLAVYGARRPDDASVLALCDDFDRQLGWPAPGGAVA